MPIPLCLPEEKVSTGFLLIIRATSVFVELSNFSMEEKIHKGIFIPFSKITTERLSVLFNVNLPVPMN